MQKNRKYPELAAILLRSSTSKSQGDIAEWCGVSQPAVSDWLNGYKRPTATIIARLISYLDLDIVSTAQAAGYDPQKIRELFSPVHQEYTALLDFADDMTNLVQRARTYGSPKVALDQSSTILRHLKLALSNSLTTNYRRDLLRLQARLLVLQERVFCECLPANQAVIPMGEIARTLHSIADELQDEQIQGFAYTTRACIDYILKRQDSSFTYNLKALEMVTDPYWRMDIIRAVAISSGQLKDSIKLTRSERQIEQILQKGNSDASITIFALEGLGRGQALMRSTKGLETLRKASDLYSKEIAERDKEPLLELQIVRSQMMATAQVEPTDVQLIEALGQKAIKLASTYNYQRYRDEVTAFLQNTIKT